mgnify:CR=1 FL=1
MCSRLHATVAIMVRSFFALSPLVAWFCAAGAVAAQQVELTCRLQHTGDEEKLVQAHDVVLDLDAGAMIVPLGDERDALRHPIIHRGTTSSSS